MRILAALLLLIPTVSLAEIEARFQISAATYSDIATTAVFQFSVGTHDQGGYLWTSYEELEVRMLDQPIADTNMYSFGVGFQHEFENELTLFMEAGWAVMDDSIRPNIRDEVVYTKLVKTHAVEGRVIPADPPEFDNDSFTSYELEDAFIGRVGLRYQIYNHIAMSVGYRMLTAKEHYELWDQSQRFGPYKLGWWQETTGRDLSAWEVGFVLNY